MQNLNFFQIITYPHGEIGSERHKKLKNQKNLIRAREFSFHKIKIFIIKNSSPE